MRIKKGDTVFIRTGQSKGKTGRVLYVEEAKNKIVVEGVNLRKKHQKPTQKNPKGGVISLEAPIHLSNVAIYSNTLAGPTRLSTKVLTEGGKKQRIRICRKTGEEI